jgi:autotransporter translocation and assembly factor TamB
LRLTLSAASPSLYGVSFDSLQAEGKKEGDALTGQIGTRLPDSLLTLSLSLREPFGFRVDGPFAVGPPGSPADGGPPVAPRDPGGANGEGETRFNVAGKVKIEGSLGALSHSRGSLDIDSLVLRDGGFDLTGEAIRVVLSSDGIRWEGGTLLTAGKPLQVTGKATWEGNLDVLLDGSVPARAIRLATDVFDRLDGTIRMRLRVTGKWDDPFVLGTGRLENGTFSFRKYAQLFEEMSADAVISRERIIFEHFEGRSGGGYIDGRGELPLRFSEGQNLFFSVDFFDMRYPYPGDLHPVVQGHIEMLGPVDDILVTGDVEVQSALYTRTVRPEQALITFRRRLADVRARREETDFRIRLDIGAVADGTIHIRNNLAEADIKGEFRVVGSTDQVILLGSFDVLNGVVTYGKNRYELTRGSLEFQDPRRINPVLDFRADTKVGNIAIFVNVSGTLEKVEVDLASDPPYSKNDIVSLLSLGVTTENLAGAGGSVSAAEAAAFALGPYKGRVEEEIRDIVGLDRFQIEPAYSSTEQSLGPRFTAGKTIGERFSVSVSTTAAANPEGSAIAEYQVFENVYLQGAWRGATPERDDDVGGDVKFRFRYRQFRDIFRDTD